MRGRHCVGGGAPVNFGRRRRAAGPKKAVRRGGGVIVTFIGGRGIARRRSGGQKNFRKNFFLSSKFSYNLYSHRKLQQYK